MQLRRKTMGKPLEGVKVIELAAHIAGPSCGRLLCDLGAEVIKIESASGDPWRQSGINYCPNRYSMEENPSYDICNSGKKSIVLDLKSEYGKTAVLKLLSTADIFFTNFRPDALQRLGLHYEQIRPAFPGLIYGISLGFGEKGPEAQKKAMDVTAFWARTGFLRDQCRKEDNHPVFPPWCVGDTAVGTQLALELTAAYINKLKTGKGDLVKTGLFQEGVFLFGHMITITQPPYGKSFPQARLDHPAEYDFLCKNDSYIMLSLVGGQKTLFSVFQLLGHGEWCEDPRFCSPEARRENKEALYGLFCDAFLKKEAKEWSEMALDYDVPLTVMPHYFELSGDEQAWANGYLEKITYPNGHVNVLPSSPICMESVGELHTEQAHAIGQDTEDVLLSVGMTV